MVTVHTTTVQDMDHELVTILIDDPPRYWKPDQNLWVYSLAKRRLQKMKQAPTSQPSPPPQSEEATIPTSNMAPTEILPKRNRADTIAEVADEALGNSQNERLPDSDDDSSDEVDSGEDYDDFWKDQKVIVDGRLADPTSEQMLHPSVFRLVNRGPYISKTNVHIMDAYRKGLSIKAAAWCVKKQKGYRSISEAIMKEFDIQEKESRSN
ncbi:hypothetical protein V8E54_014672 [Elaphomyces granulatus]